jgi:hypothetical protein
LIAGTRVFFLGIASQSMDYKTIMGANNIELDNPLNMVVVIKTSQLLEFKTILGSLVKKK